MRGAPTPLYFFLHRRFIADSLSPPYCFPSYLPFYTANTGLIFLFYAFDSLCISYLIRALFLSWFDEASGVFGVYTLPVVCCSVAVCFGCPFSPGVFVRFLGWLLL